MCICERVGDKYARKTYTANFEKISPKLFDPINVDRTFVGDITKIDYKIIPEADIVTGGFPCQPFSNMGLRKGFNDSRGTLFFDIAKIIKEKKPKAYFLENVRGLLSNDKGKTFETMKKVLTEDLGYSLFYKVVKASDFGLRPI